MVRFVRCIMSVVVLSALVLIATGCATWARTQSAMVGFNYPHADGETLGLTGSDHRQRIARSSAHDARALVEDLDLLFLTERPTRLSRWQSR